MHPIIYLHYLCCIIYVQQGGQHFLLIPRKKLHCSCKRMDAYRFIICLICAGTNSLRLAAVRALRGSFTASAWIAGGGLDPHPHFRSAVSAAHNTFWGVPVTAVYHQGAIFPYGTTVTQPCSVCDGRRGAFYFR